jgi:hypothetical protein
MPMPALVSSMPMPSYAPYAFGLIPPTELVSDVDPKWFFSDRDPTLTLISDPDPYSNPDPACLWKIHKKFRSSKHRKKAGLFRKIHLNCRLSKHCKKAIFFDLYIFTALYLLLETDLNLDPESDPDPN